MLLEVKAVIDVVVRSNLSLYSIHANIVRPYVSTSHPVINSTLAGFLSVRRMVATGSRVDDDVLCRESHIDALVDCCVDVQVPNRATIDEYLASEVSWNKSDWD